MTTPSIDVLDYLRSAFHQDQIAALVTQNPDGTIVITADVGPGSSSLVNQPLVGATGNAGTNQFGLLVEPDIFTTPANLPGPGVLTPTAADLGKFWMIAQQDNNGNFISVGAYIWFGMQFRFLPFGPAGPPGPYPVITPKVSLLGPGQTSTYNVTPITGGGLPSNPDIAQFNLSIPTGPTGPGPTLASMADFLPLVPTVGQFITATGQQVTFQGQTLKQWGPANTGDLPLMPFIVPQSAFFAQSGIVLGNVLAKVNDTISALAGFAGQVTATIGAVYDQAVTALGGGVISRNNTTSAVHTLFNTIQTNYNALASAISSSNTAGTAISGFVYDLTHFGGTITGAIQTAADNLANVLGLSGVGNTLAAVANTVASTLQQTTQSIINALSGTGIPTIGAFTVPANPWAWKPLVFGQIRMFEAEFSLQPLLMGISVTMGWPGGIQVARGFGNTLSGVVNVVPHTSSPGNPSFAMNPWNSIATVPAGQPGALFINVVNDGIAAVYNYQPSDAQIFVLACPVTTQAQLGLSTPASLRNKLALQVASVHSP